MGPANRQTRSGRPEAGAHDCVHLRHGSGGQLSAALYERGGYDIRLEAALAKLYNTEAGWRIIDDTMQIRGGRGYEMAE